VLLYKNIKSSIIYFIDGFYFDFLSTSLFLEVHPNLESDDKEAVRKGFGMKAEQNELIITERADLLYIMTKQWNIDIDDTDDGKYYKFILKPYI